MLRRGETSFYNGVYHNEEGHCNQQKCERQFVMPVPSVLLVVLPLPVTHRKVRYSFLE